jgi:aminodeoxyfutalosine deaminase
MSEVEILTAGWVLPVSRPPIRDGALAVRDERIVWVGRRGAAGQPGGRERALGAGVLIPGLVNAHTHLELSACAGRLDGAQGFADWVRALVALRPVLEREALRDGVRAALASLETYGTVAVGDVTNRLEDLDLLAAAPLDAVVLHEVIGWASCAAGEIAAQARARVAQARATWGGARLRVRLAAHAPHSVSPELLAALADDGGLASIHLAESEAETRFLLDGGGEWAAFLTQRDLGGVAFVAPGLSPVAYLERLGVLRSGLVAVHCVQVDETDARLLADRGIAVVLCPRSNRRLVGRLAPLPLLLRAGLLPALGTDSLASVETLDLREEMRLLDEVFPEVGRDLLLRMATWAGAAALGLEDLGALAPGYRAALAYAPASIAVDDPFEHLFARATPLQLVTR